MTKIDMIDKTILNILLEDSKLSYRQIAKKANISVGTVMNRIQKLTKEDVIKKYSISLDYNKLGFDLAVIIDVKVAKGKMLDVEKKISQIPHVVSVYDVTGDFDICLIARFENRLQLDTFVKNLQTMEHIERTYTKLILNALKEEGMSFPGIKIQKRRKKK